MLKDFKLKSAIPCINMQTTTYAKISKQKIKDFEFKKFKLLKSTINKMTKYIKGHNDN